MIGVTAMSAWETENVAFLREGDSVSLGNYEFTLTGTQVTQGPNFEAERLTFAVGHDGKPDGQIETERRFYPERQSFTTEAGIRPGLFSNLYVAYGESGRTDGYSVRVNYHPFAMWIWLGGFTIAGGGLISLSDRRFRVAGLHKTARQPAVLRPEVV